MIPGAFDYYAPASVDEALNLLRTQGEDAKILAGGQSLFPLMKLRLSSPAALIDLGRIPGLDRVRVSAEDGGIWIRIGALTPYSHIESSDLLRQSCPLLPQTAAVVADRQVRNRGTIGGSIAHADPTGDVPAAALALGAEVLVASLRGQRWVPTTEFFTGFFETVLEADEILTEVRVPVLDGWRTAYLKAAPRAAGFAVAGIAICLRIADDGTCGDIRVGVTGVTDRPYRATSVEDNLRGQPLTTANITAAVSTITEGLWIADDLRASADYRAHLARVYARRAIEAARDQ